MLLPRAWQEDEELDRDVAAFHSYHAGLVEPWDGPAAIVFTDGRVVGAALDRNGLRPLRVATAGSFVACASEAGAVPLDPSARVRRSRLGPGELLAVDPGLGFEEDATISRRLARSRPYRRWLGDGRRTVAPGQPLDPPDEELTPRQLAAGYTREDITLLLRPSAADGHEPTSSMGDDTALPPLAGRARPLFSYLRQRFAQVTNPPIDHLRERSLMSLRTLIGRREPLLSQGPEAAHLIELESFLLYPSGVAELHGIRLSTVLQAGERLDRACERLAAQASALVDRGADILVLTDEDTTTAIPALLALGAVHQRLVASGRRSLVSLVVVSDEPRDSHHLACLLGYGADAVCPRLALETVAALAAADRLGGDHPSPGEAQRRFRAALEDGVLKVMAKMGIADVASYRGAQLFEALGLAREVIELCLTGTPSSLGGIGFAELERELRARRTAERKLESPGYVKYRPGGEPHATTPEVAEALQAVAAAHALRRAVDGRSGTEEYRRFAALVDGRVPLEPRDLLELVPAGPPVPLDEVEPVEAILRRFSSGGMSHGSLSAEAHETVAIAFNRLGGRSNCGEGGEDPARFRDERNSRIKQVASGRFGVTPEYAAYADELQIKIAQGSKPGEGGQLPGHKVTAEIARLRHTEPGIGLISPPPHHDIYSIEDLAQLVFDLKQVNPAAAVSVKLVAEAGVGLVAAGVVKALADVVHVAGCDGGTGASPLSSIKNAGVPWELGLAETQQTLVAEGLRSRVRLRVDGGLKTGQGCRRRGAAGRRRGLVRNRAAARRGLPDGALLPPRHLPGRDRDAEAGAALQVRGDAGACARRTCCTSARTCAGTWPSLGLRTFAEAVGRVECLRRREPRDEREAAVDPSPLLRRGGPGPVRHEGEPQPEQPGGELGAQLAAAAAAALDGAALVELKLRGHQPRSRRRRTAGRRDRRPSRHRRRCPGACGWSWPARRARASAPSWRGGRGSFSSATRTTASGSRWRGGRIVVRPPEGDAGDPVLIGNAALYGATGGQLFCAGRAGERFAVRNSGAVAVVEGVGAHGCEYMTAGTVVILGETGRNLAAGMSGGELFVHDPEGAVTARLNHELVEAVELDVASTELLHGLLERHLGYTDSARAAELLARWPESASEFSVVRAVHASRRRRGAEALVGGRLTRV